jgi:tetratricopeptide (TPR) repeat protein
MKKSARPAKKKPPKSKLSKQRGLFLTIEQNKSCCFAAVVAFALILRFVYLRQIESIPLFSHLAGDGRTYDEWAQRIAGGDWLGSGVFYQAPLYPYFLGVLQTVLGHNLWWIRFVQLSLGALSCGLIFLVGDKVFSRGAGLAAGIILACYAPAIFFDALIEKSVLDLFLLSLLLFLLFAKVDDESWRKWLGAGAILGLLGLSRENALVLAPVIAVWLAIDFSEKALSFRARWLVYFFTGLLLILLPVGLRNLALGGEFKLTTSQFGPNFFIGNNPAADGTYGSVHKIIGEPQLEGSDAARLAGRALRRRMSLGEVSDYWLGKSLDYIRSEPLDWLRLLAKKWLMVWNAREVEDSDDLYIYRRWSWLLMFLSRIGHFGILAPLAAAGIWLSRKEWRRLWPLWGMIVSLSLSVAVFYVFARYRFPLVPLLALFAGAALVQLASLYREQEWRASLGALSILTLSAVAVNWPIYGFSGPGAAGFNNLSNAYYKQGQVSEAINLALKALEVEPDLGVADYNLGNLYAGQGRFDVAKKYFEEALRIYPNYAEVRANYGQLLAERGDLETGIRYFRKAIELNPSISRAHLNLGVALAKQGKFADAIGPLQQAAALTPAAPEPIYYLGSVYAAENRYTDAVSAFKQALQRDPDFVPAHQSLAQLFALQGNTAEATAHQQEALRLIRQSGSNSGLR